MRRVEELMTKHIWTCYVGDSLDRAAELMWDHDCGAVPVVDEHNRLVGIVTDRDACMAAYTRGGALRAIRVAEVCSRKVLTCRPDDSVGEAERLMVGHQLRRLPVVDEEGRVVGMLTLADLAQNLRLVAVEDGEGLSPRSLALILDAVTRPRQRAPEPALMVRPSDALVAPRDS